MDIVTTTEQITAWPLWRKIIFRFFFVYFFLQLSIVSWLNAVPGVTYVTKYYSQGENWIVTSANAKMFHIRQVLVPENGSGDTSMGWARLWLYLIVALIGSVIWSALDKKRTNYDKLNYWLCTFARYFVALVAFSYGIVKLFCLQMDFPSLHQLATPIGDLLPMRFSWFFIGYSGPYQMFSGAMEVFAGVLLLYRRTASFGVFVAAGVFINVMMLNLCYDIPVKIFSMQMVFTCLFLLFNESERFVNFFILNKAAAASHLYRFNYHKKWMRISRIVAKVVFILLNVALGFYNNYDSYKSYNGPPIKYAFKNGVYQVTDYSIGKRSTPLAVTDSLRWQDVILENGSGSANTGDTTFRKFYNRHYFGYKIDTAKHSVGFTRRMPNDSIVALMAMHYTLPDTNTIKLWGTHGKDSVFIELKRTKRHFQLAEKQFHWLTEYNR